MDERKSYSWDFSLQSDHRLYNIINFIDDDNLNSLLAAITQVNLLYKVPYGIYS